MIRSPGFARLRAPMHAMQSAGRFRALHASAAVMGGGGPTKFWGKIHSHLPDYIENWSPQKFKMYGVGGSVAAVGVLGLQGPLTVSGWIPAAVMGYYWYIGLQDMNQTSHALRRNFPVIGNIRYLLESIRPELRQYLIESDTEQSGVPFSREFRSVAYQRAKGMTDTVPLGTKHNVYDVGYEWAQHSMYPKEMDVDSARVTVGGPECKQPYSAALLNVSGMSYGALSDNAIRALNKGAKLGGFYHNTGEGGISQFHKENGGDLVWNVGTGYFACRNKDGSFSEEMFKETSNLPAVKMIELKLSQGAKPAHGGVLPQAKITKLIADARGIPFPATGDCNSPPRHSAFSNAEELVLFLGKMRELSGGKPVGFKLCVGRPEEFMAIVHAMLQTGIVPDFITVDGGEGGTGAAPPEFSNSIGTPLVEGLTLVNNVLRGAGLRKDIKIICSGKVLTGFSMVQKFALGADVCNAARAMMYALGCIQALKCNTNKCPTGVATTDARLMEALHVDDKASRVANFQHRTVVTACEIMGAIGCNHPSELRPTSLMSRVSIDKTMSYAERYPMIPSRCLLDGTAPKALQFLWDRTADRTKNSSAHIPKRSEIISRRKTHGMQVHNVDA